MVKYIIQYDDIEGVTHSISIDDPNFSGSATFVNGRAFMSYSTTDDVLEPIRGAGLKIEMDADQEMDFSDLYNELERTFKVIYTRDGVIEFQGFLNSEGYFESFVEDKWQVSFDVVDGLGFLKDLAFVDSNGLPFLGKMSQKDVLTNALARCGIDKTLTTSIDIKYLGLADNLDVLDNVYVVTERYRKDDKEQTIMPCEEVIKDILDTYNAVLISKGTEWKIVRPNYLYRQSVDTTLGSEIKGFYPHHCNANQTISFKGSLGGYRINYKYGLRKSFIDNYDFYSADGVTMEEWVIVEGVTLKNPGYGATILADSDTNSGSTGGIVNNLYSAPVDGLLEGLILDIKFSYKVGNVSLGEYVGGRAYFRITLESATKTYYLMNDGGWSESQDGFSFDFFADSGVFGFETTAPLPELGDLVVYIRTPVANEYPVEDQSGNETFERVKFDMEFTSVNVSLAEEGTLSEVGENHTFQRLDNPNPKVDSVKEVFTADNASDLFVGTLYKADTITPTTEWTRKTFNDNVPILRLMGTEIMRMNQLPSRLFNGDIYGVIPYDNVVAIDGINDKDGFPCKFMFVEWDYDTRENVVAMTLRQIYGGDISDLDYQYTKDYGNVVEPTIRG